MISFSLPSATVWNSAVLSALALLAPPLRAQTSLAALLELAGRRVELFVEELPSVACTESVLQSKLGDGQKVLSRHQSRYDYLILLEITGGELAVQESRLPLPLPGKPPATPLVETSGFATLLLIFHPHYQPGFNFRLLAPEISTGSRLYRIAFEHKPGFPTPAVLDVRGRQYPLAWRGTASLDPASGMITLIHVELREPLDDIGLTRLAAETRYQPTPFAGLSESVWLPAASTIEVHTRRQHWLNTHNFSAFRRFDVTADTRTEGIRRP